MIVQLPQGTTSLVLRLDGSGTGADVVLQLASQGYGPALASGPAPRRRTLLACAALGAVAGAVGLSFWNAPARSEAALNLPHQAAWNDRGCRSRGMPCRPRWRSSWHVAPSVIPPPGALGTPDAPPRSSPASAPASAPGKNPFGLE